ncbi:recombinase family protein [Rhizobium grahamii]|uniref:Recombinase family protein n=1 Tax=Rhizobium grahamii TaxID=1120045 RepID=A0A5Q0C5D3_9HYPH|nr:MULTISPECIES: recombinase family protein [Rhizobium]QFY61158.1 recombinase family protein [Rhizobium grahamii]QRM49689.1 recombinase family protein [Rhizobium sp. BG6]
MTRNVLFYARHSAGYHDHACLETQLYYGHRFIKENGWTFVKSYADEDIGEVVFMAQPGVRKLFAHIEREAIDIVLCHTLDRLCSRFDIASRLLSELARKGIELWVADPGERITARNLSDHYIDDGSNMFAKGSHIAHVPDDLREDEHLVPLAFGYRYKGAFNADRQYILGFTAVDTDAANAVQQIFQLYTEGMSPAKIAALLNTLGIAGPRGKAWRDVTIRGDRTQSTGILNDQIYLGRFWIPGRASCDFVPALQIVTQDLWHRVKQRQRLAARGGTE